MSSLAEQHIHKSDATVHNIVAGPLQLVELDLTAGKQTKCR